MSKKSYEVEFKEVSEKLARTLLHFAKKRNIGKSITIDNQTYKLDYISRSSNSYWRSRGLSIYYRVGRSVVRISDHWSNSKQNPRSRKLNCGFIDQYIWNINNKNKPFAHSGHSSGKYPFMLLAGRAGLSKLNKSCPHWV